jgi:hypothetical protein
LNTRSHRAGKYAGLGIILSFVMPPVIRANLAGAMTINKSDPAAAVRGFPRRELSPIEQRADDPINTRSRLTEWNTDRVRNVPSHIGGLTCVRLFAATLFDL